MAQIGSLTVDLALDSASFIADIQKSASAVARSTSEMNASLKNFGAGINEIGRVSKDILGGGLTLVTERLAARLRALVTTSLDLAKAVGGDLGAAAEDTESKLRAFKSAFDLGIAQGFTEGLNQELTKTDDLLREATVDGRELGRALGDSLGMVLKFTEGFNERLEPLAKFLNWVTDLAQSGAYIAPLDGAEKKVISLTKAYEGLQETTIQVNQAFLDLIAAGGDKAAFWQTTVTATREWTDALRELPQILKATESPLEQYQSQIAKIAQLQTTELLTSQQAFKAQELAAISLADTYVGAAGKITSTLAGAFQNNKNFALANAVVNIAEGVTQALKLPFPLNWAQVAAVTAAGVAQIAAIRSAQPGSASVARSSSGAGGGASPSAGASRAPVNQQSVYVNIVGDTFSRQQVVTLAEQLKKYQRDGGSILIN